MQKFYCPCPALITAIDDIMKWHCRAYIAMNRLTLYYS